MNERIKELEKQCYERVYADMCDGYDVVFDKKKFAELIVRECLEILNVKEYSYQNGDLAEKIKEHFGVEE